MFCFYAIIAIEHGFGALIFNTSLGTWRMLMHEKPWLIPIIIPWTFFNNTLNTEPDAE